MAREKPVRHVLEAVSSPAPPADIFQSGAQLNETTINFLKIDLDTARTFAEIALKTEDSEKKERNRQNARLGYNTVLRLLPKVSPTAADSKILAERIALLKADLVKLGEAF